MKCEPTKVLVMCADAIPSAILGVFEPLKKIRNIFPVDVEFVKTLDLRKKHLDNCDVLVCVRSSENLEVKIVEACQKAEKFLIYYIDDDLLNIPTVVNCAQYFDDNNIRQNIVDIIRMCDMLLSVNPLLLKKYGKYCERQILVKGPATLLDYCNNRRKVEDNIVRIGFAGSIDHSRTLDSIAKEALVKLSKEYGDRLVFEFVGSKPNLINELSNVRYVPYMSNIDEYREFMCNCSWDIGLAPLPEGDFFRHKYFNKFLEYGAAGVCGVYSQIEPFTFIVKDGYNGILTNNTPEDWYNNLKKLIEDKELRNKIADNAFILLNEKYTLKGVGIEMVERVKEFTAYKASGEKVSLFGLTPLQNRMLIWKGKIFRIMRRHGFLGILIILKIIYTKLLSKVHAVKR